MKIHLGCWHRNIPGFINVDLCDLPHIHYKSSIGSLPFFLDNTAQLIYCSHALEYFDRAEAMNVLKEWFRVLKPGGILRLSVPDFNSLIKVYKLFNYFCKQRKPTLLKRILSIKQFSQINLGYSN